MAEKICPIMAQGWIAGYMSIRWENPMDSRETIRSLPKCLKEKCALWIPESFAGSLHGEARCGLMRR